MFFKYFSRNTSYKAIGRKVLIDHASRGNDTAVADRHTFQDHTVHADPDMIADGNGPGLDMPPVRYLVVIAVPDDHVLRNGYIIPDRNTLKAGNGGIAVDITAPEGQCGARRYRHPGIAVYAEVPVHLQCAMLIHGQEGRKGVPVVEFTVEIERFTDLYGGPPIYGHPAVPEYQKFPSRTHEQGQFYGSDDIQPEDISHEYF